MPTIRFHPQAWVNDYAVEVDAEGPTEWEVSEEEINAIAKHYGVSRTDVLTPDTYESDDLRYTANAPQWVKDWGGPFYCSAVEASA